MKKQKIKKKLSHLVNKKKKKPKKVYVKRSRKVYSPERVKEMCDAFSEEEELLLQYQQGIIDLENNFNIRPVEEIEADLTEEKKEKFRDYLGKVSETLGVVQEGRIVVSDFKCIFLMNQILRAEQGMPEEEEVAMLNLCALPIQEQREIISFIKNYKKKEEV